MAEQSRPPAHDKKLRRGWTTGACATAASVVACQAVLTGDFPEAVEIFLPKGHKPVFPVADSGFEEGGAYAAIVKDAGDDPDITHGVSVYALVRPGAEGEGISFRAGPGVGVVRLKGLPLAVGEPAINPAPRKMIIDNLKALCLAHRAQADFEITLSIPGGEALALKTWNPKLGIEGGLSILGTTGIVIPYSCSSWIHSIHRGIDVARANSKTHLVACTGRTSEEVAMQIFDLAPTELIDMGDFAGGMLKYLKRHPVEKVTICGGIAKMTKLAQGHLDLHSARSQVDFDKIAELARNLNADEAVEKALRKMVAMSGLAEILEGKGELYQQMLAALACRARQTALAVLANETEIDVMMVTREGQKAVHLKGGEVSFGN